MTTKKLPTVFGFVTVSLVMAVCAVFLAGCVRYPRAEAPARSRMLREKGYGHRADEMLRDAESGSGVEIRSKSLDEEMRKDIYHSPELAIPEGKRKYNIKFSTAR